MTLYLSIQKSKQIVFLLKMYKKTLNVQPFSHYYLWHLKLLQQIYENKRSKKMLK